MSDAIILSTTATGAALSSALEIMLLAALGVLVIAASLFSRSLAASLQGSSPQQQCFQVGLRSGAFQPPSLPVGYYAGGQSSSGDLTLLTAVRNDRLRGQPLALGDCYIR